MRPVRLRFFAEDGNIFEELTQRDLNLYDLEKSEDRKALADSILGTIDDMLHQDDQK